MIELLEKNFITRVNAEVLNATKHLQPSALEDAANKGDCENGLVSTGIMNRKLETRVTHDELK